MKKILFDISFTNRKHGIFILKTENSNGKMISYKEAKRLMEKYPDSYIIENKENYDMAADKI